MRKGTLASLALGLVFVSVVATGAVAASTASDGLEVTPTTAIRGTVPGRLVEETVTVVNLSHEDFSVTGTLGDARVDTGGRFSAAAGSGLPSAAAWGSMQPASFLLPAGHTQNVTVTFTPPKGTTGGGYYAAVDFAGRSGSGVSASATHAVLLEVAGGDVIRAPTIASISAPQFAFGPTIPVTMRLVNTGNDYAVAEGKLTVLDQFSRVAGTVDIPRTPVVPGTPRILTIHVPTPLIPGHTHVTARLSFGLGVPEDSATTATNAIGWWQLGVAIALLLLIVRLIVAIVRWRRRRRALKRERRAAEQETRAPVPVGANGGGFADYEPLAHREPASPRVEAAPQEQAVAEPAPEEHHAFTAPSEDEDLWPEPVVVPRAPAAPAEERPRPRLVFSRPADDPFAELEKLSPPAALDDEEPELEGEEREEPEADIEMAAEFEEPLTEEPEPEPEPVVADEPVAEPEPEPQAAPALTVVRPLPADDDEMAVMPMAAGDSTTMVARTSVPAVASVAAPAAALPEEQLRGAADRTARLSEKLLESIGDAPAPGREASQRRARVAIEMLTTGGGKSADRIPVALKVLRSSGADASAMLGEAFDAEAAAGRDASFATLALALHEVAGGRAVEALLRAYAVAKRGQIVALRTALKTYDADALAEHQDLLDALPADRRAALKPAKR